MRFNRVILKKPFQQLNLFLDELNIANQITSILKDLNVIPIKIKRKNK